MNLHNKPRIKHPFHFLIDSELKEWLDIEAANSGMSTAAYVRQLIIKAKKEDK